MQIVGLDSLVFGVEDLDASVKTLSDYGLIKADSAPSGGVFEALDGTSAVVRRASDPGLPPAFAPSPNIRETIYGVADRATLEKIGAELSRDRKVMQDSDGTLHSFDDSGFPIGFRVTVRRKIDAPPVLINVPGMPAQRPKNVVASRRDAEPKPRTLSHVVFFVPDAAKAEKFYVERLGFRIMDRFTGFGVFLRPAGSADHHCLFLIQMVGPMPLGLNHFTFHWGDAGEVLYAGWRFQRKGYRSFWGPGRHVFGSNYFWYFNSPFGGALEFDADMDQHDDSWQPRSEPPSYDSTQLYLFEYREPWVPG